MVVALGMNVDLQARCFVWESGPLQSQQQAGPQVGFCGHLPTRLQGPNESKSINTPVVGAYQRHMITNT